MTDTFGSWHGYEQPGLSLPFPFSPETLSETLIAESKSKLVMIIRKQSLWAVTSALLSLSNGLSQADIPADIPVDSLVSSAKASLASGKPQDALIYYDVAISRDPKAYINIFQRGATYLSLGKSKLATDDFDKVLSMKPDFESALLQRAKIKGKNADWDAAKKDYEKAGKKSAQEYEDLVQAQEAATKAQSAETAKDWETCVAEAGTAVRVASTDLDLRQRRARCRFEMGAVLEGVSDLQHVLQLAPGSVDPQLQISSMLFYAMGDTDKGLAAVKACLRSDPESKPCKKLNRQQKNIEKRLKKIKGFEDKGQYIKAVGLLVGDGGEDHGLIEDIKVEMAEAKKSGTIYQNAPSDFYAGLVEKTCYFYNEVRHARSPCAEPC